MSKLKSAAQRVNQRCTCAQPRGAGKTEVNQKCAKKYLDKRSNAVNQRCTKRANMQTSVQKTNKQRCTCTQPRGAGKVEVRKKRGKKAHMCRQAFKNDLAMWREKGGGEEKRGKYAEKHSKMK